MYKLYYSLVQGRVLQHQMWGEMTTKPEVITAHCNSGVDVPINATVTQLHQLLAQTVGAANPQIDETTTASPTNSVEADVQSNVQNDSQHNLNLPHVENVFIITSTN